MGAVQEAAMRKRLSGFVLVLITMMLSCNVPMAHNTSPTNLISVTVTPPSGEKDFNLEVAYKFEWDREYGNDEIYCTYTSPSGRIIPIGEVNPTGMDRDREAFSKVATMPFSVKSVNGSPEIGIYTAACSTQEVGGKLTTAFVVTQPATATPEAPSYQATEPPAARPALKGRIIFDYKNANTNPAGWGAYLDEVVKNCIPNVNIGVDSSIHGECEYSGTTIHLENATVTVLVTGSIDKLGNVTFSYEVSEIGAVVENNNHIGTWRISFTGHGMFTSATQASGNADFGYDCNSGSENRLWCQSQTSSSFSGSLPWSFVPSQ
jgi:hypothetical protein